MSLTQLATGGLLAAAIFGLTQPRPEKKGIHDGRGATHEMSRHIRRPRNTPHGSLVATMANDDGMGGPMTYRDVIRHQERQQFDLGMKVVESLREPNTRTTIHRSVSNRAPYPILPERERLPPGLFGALQEGAEEQYFMVGRKPGPVPRPPQGNVLSQELVLSGFHF